MIFLMIFCFLTKRQSPYTLLWNLYLLLNSPDLPPCRRCPFVYPSVCETSFPVKWSVANLGQSWGTIISANFWPFGNWNIITLFFVFVLFCFVVFWEGGFPGKYFMHVKLDILCMLHINTIVARCGMIKEQSITKINYFLNKSNINRLDTQEN